MIFPSACRDNGRNTAMGEGVAIVETEKWPEVPSRDVC